MIELKQKDLQIGILMLAVIGIVLISGCLPKSNNEPADESNITIESEATKQFISNCSIIEKKVSEDPSIDDLLRYCEVQVIIKNNRFEDCESEVFAQQTDNCMLGMITKHDQDTGRCKIYAQNTGRIFAEQDCIINVAAKMSDLTLCNKLEGFARQKCDAYATRNITFCKHICNIEGDKIMCQELVAISSVSKSDLPMKIDSCIMDMVEKTGDVSLCDNIQRAISVTGCIHLSSKLAKGVSHCDKSPTRDVCILLTSISQMRYYCDEIRDEKTRQQCELFFN